MVTAHGRVEILERVGQVGEANLARDMNTVLAVETSDSRVTAVA